MKRFLITGAAGFLGSHLSRKVIEQGAVAHVLVHPQESLWRLEPFQQAITEGRLIIHPVDLTDRERMKTIVTEAAADIIIHAAAYGGMPFEQDQQLVYEVNFNASRDFFLLCKKIGFELFIGIGSSSEYGFKERAFAESMLLEPRSDYAVAKTAFSAFLYKEAVSSGLPAYTIRPFSLYGDAELSTRLIPTILKAAIFNTPLFLSAPQYLRDYLYIPDMVSCIFALIEKKPREALIFNAGTGKQTSIGELITIIEKITDKKLDVHWGTQTPRPWEPSLWCADTTLTENVLHWKAEYTLEAGLRAALDWFSRYYTAPIISYEEALKKSSSLQNESPYERPSTFSKLS